MQKCCIPYIPCRSLLLSTTVLNDTNSTKIIEVECDGIVSIGNDSDSDVVLSSNGSSSSNGRYTHYS